MNVSNHGVPTVIDPRTSLAARALEPTRRYIARTAMSNECIAVTHSEQVRYALKEFYRDGGTQMNFNPLDLMALASNSQVEGGFYLVSG